MSKTKARKNPLKKRFWNRFKHTDVRSEPNKAPKMRRVVIDTNVLVSALIASGKPRRLVLKLLEEHKVILSRQMLAELADVLTRDKFNVKSAQIDRFLASLVGKSKIVSAASHFKVITDDPDDDIVLNTAYYGKADYIVTGDKHLLALKELKTIKIVNVTNILEILRWKNTQDRIYSYAAALYKGAIACSEHNSSTGSVLDSFGQFELL